MKTRFSRLAVLICCLLTYFTPLFAQGDLLIFPKRVVFEGKARSEQVLLVNNGRDTATYAVTFVQVRMNENGSFSEIARPDPGQLFADKNLRVFPRTVTLAPNEQQTVRVQPFQTDALDTGEYRSHLVFRAVQQTSASNAPQAGIDTTLSVTIRPLFGISIPIIIRKGNPTATLRIDSLAITTMYDTVPALHMQLHREGNASVYGDVTVTHTDETGKKSTVAFVRGIAVYTPNRVRKLLISLDRQTSTYYKKGKLEVRFDNGSDNAKVLLATAELQLGNAPAALTLR